MCAVSKISFSDVADLLTRKGDIDIVTSQIRSLREDDSSGVTYDTVRQCRIFDNVRSFVVAWSARLETVCADESLFDAVDALFTELRALLWSWDKYGKDGAASFARACLISTELYLVLTDSANKIIGELRSGVPCGHWAVWHKSKQEAKASVNVSDACRLVECSMCDSKLGIDLSIFTHGDVYGVAFSSRNKSSLRISGHLR